MVMIKDDHHFFSSDSLFIAIVSLASLLVITILNVKEKRHENRR
ncbi:hypothetical protein BN1221_02002 [Brenneria goodwinii]|uniref:Uncharacterized protein n=1 Tax=Brenneria goodwinii TaxID=1109412 RepID=A0A0G4JUI2_9GAMM|nr:hypothetical protein BN1221_02002 [Brenneria goodwinii]